MFELTDLRISQQLSAESMDIFNTSPDSQEITNIEIKKWGI